MKGIAFLTEWTEMKKYAEVKGIRKKSEYWIQ